MKKLGILGGVGPQTTADVYLSVIKLIKKYREDKYPPIFIHNLPFPFVYEDEIIVRGENPEKMLPYLIDGARILEKAGADFGILPCNTLHKFIKNIRAATSIPFLSILEETALVVKDKKIHKVGILATEATVQGKLYEDILNKNDIEVIYPTKAEQIIINNIIIELIGGVKSARHIKEIKKICNMLRKNGAQGVLLACTDLQLAMSGVIMNVPVIDTTQVIIDAAVREMRRK